MVERNIGSALAAIAMALSGMAHQAAQPFMAYHDGAQILFQPDSTGSGRQARFGPWNLGEQLDAIGDKPRDNRLNLYVVVPGIQYHAPSHAEYDHNLVVNKYTVDGKPREWDLFWCLALDPNFSGDLRSERELLLAAQQSFFPPDFFSLEDVPSIATLAEKLDVLTIEGLGRFRHRDGSFPRMLIVPAHLAVRATAEIPKVSRLPTARAQRSH